MQAFLWFLSDLKREFYDLVIRKSLHKSDLNVKFSSSEILKNWRSYKHSSPCWDKNDDKISQLKLNVKVTIRLNFFNFDVRNLLCVCCVYSSKNILFHIGFINKLQLTHWQINDTSVSAKILSIKRCGKPVPDPRFGNNPNFN